MTSEAENDRVVQVRHAVGLTSVLNVSRYCVPLTWDSDTTRTMFAGRASCARLCVDRRSGEERRRASTALALSTGGVPKAGARVPVASKIRWRCFTLPGPREWRTGVNRPKESRAATTHGELLDSREPVSRLRRHLGALLDIGPQHSNGLRARRVGSRACWLCASLYTPGWRCR